MKKNLIVVPPKCPDRYRNTKKDCRILLIPDTASGILRSFNADCVVSYGMNEKSSLTLSSVSDEEMVVSLQRELPTLDGEILERQELKMRRPLGMPEESILAVAGTLLLTGVPPEKLPDFF